MKSYDESLDTIYGVARKLEDLRSDPKFRHNKFIRTHASDALRALDRLRRRVEAQRDEPSEGRDYQ